MDDSHFGYKQHFLKEALRLRGEIEKEQELWKLWIKLQIVQLFHLFDFTPFKTQLSFNLLQAVDNWVEIWINLRA
jgi:hypothetical protein